MSAPAPKLADAAEIAAFARDGRNLHQIRWLDADGKLVARTIAVTLQLVKKGERGSLEIHCRADDAFMAIEGRPDPALAQPAAAA